MISEVRKLHKKTSTREKFLLLLFVGGIALVWLSYSFSRYNQAYKIHSGNMSQINTYDDILSQKEYVEAQLLEKSSQLDASKTLSSTELTGRITAIVSAMELKSYTINTPQTEEGSLFTFHNVRLTVNKVELAIVLKLSDQLKTLVPYVTLDRVIVTPDRSNPNITTAQFFISSVEMAASSS